MNIFGVTFFILLLHSCLGHDEGTYGKYLQSKCESDKHNFAVSIGLLPVESEVQLTCGGSLINMQWSLTVARCVHELFRQRVQRAVRHKRSGSICIKTGFDELGGFIFEKVKRFVDSEIVKPIRDRLSLVELENPFKPHPNVQPPIIPKNPEDKLESCPEPETVSVVPCAPCRKKLETTTIVTTTTSKRPIVNNITTDYVIERICRSVTIVQEAGCVCQLVNRTLPILKTRKPTTRKPTTRKRRTRKSKTRKPKTRKSKTRKPKPGHCHICGVKKVPGQSKDPEIIKAEDEPPSEFRKPISNMSSCIGSIGSPLSCNGVLLGIEIGCNRGGARGDFAEASFSSIESYLDFIGETIGDPSIKSDRKEIDEEVDKKDIDKKVANKKETTTKETTSGADILKGNIGKVNLLAGIVTFVSSYLA